MGLEADSDEVATLSVFAATGVSSGVARAGAGGFGVARSSLRGVGVL